MTERMSALDASFLYLEEPMSAMHVGSVMLVDPGEGFDLERLRELVQARIALIPRYRQRVRMVPGYLATPVWVDAEHFDIRQHLRQETLPAPGDRGQLSDAVAEIQSRPLDRRRPLWELVVLDGLADGRLAIVTKVHQALVDGEHAVDLSHVLWDATADVPLPPPVPWHPSVEPTSVELLVGAVVDGIRRPREMADTVRAGVGDLRASARKAATAVAGLTSAVGIVRRPTSPGSLSAGKSERRRFVMLSTALADYRRIHTARTVENCSVNDVVLAVITGALRIWLFDRGNPVVPETTMRALVPVSVRGRADAPLGRVSFLLIDLPIGEPNPLIRLHRVGYQTTAHRQAGQAVAAPALVGLAGFAPPTLHSLGARMAQGLSHRLFDLVISNVPGPQSDRFLNGSRLTGTFPVIPLARGQALSIGATSYDGAVHYGLFGERDAMHDLDALAGFLHDSLDELREATEDGPADGGGRSRASVSDPGKAE